jgi:hypothetical protein
MPWRLHLIGAFAILSLASPALGACGAAGTAAVPTSVTLQPTATELAASPTQVFATPTPAPSPTPDLVRGAACLPGEWELDDPAAYFESALRASGSPVQFQGVTGSLSYRFNPQGVLEIGYTEFSVSLHTPVEGGSMLTRSTLDGFASAEYRTLDEKNLTLSAFGGDGALFLIEVDGQLLVQTTLPAWASFFAALSQASGAPAQAETAPAEVQAAYNCAGGRLTLGGAGLPVEMVLNRVNE